MAKATTHNEHSDWLFAGMKPHWAKEVREMGMAETETRLPINTLVIVNTCDQPKPGLVAAIIGFEDGFYQCRYISERLKDWPVMDTRAPTPIADFGVTLIRERNYFSTKVLGESRATYEDGKLRLWQDYSNESPPLNQWALDNLHALFPAPTPTQDQQS